MTSALAHRGPDDEDLWIDEEGHVALGHRRLAIIDLSAAGRQPMISPSGTWVISYNGEIYNFAELRSDLSQRHGVQFRSSSDTEVLLAAIDIWGLEKTLLRVNGMFAFAAWNRDRRELTLARDPLGEKPMYYGWAGDDFVFASDLSAVRRHPACPTSIDKDGLAALLRYKYIAAPTTILCGISKLRAGEMVTLTTAGRHPALSSHRYWDSVARARGCFGRQRPRSDAEAIDEVEATLQEAVRARTVSDVPIGAFLSGGIDSSAIVALLAATSTDVRTYSIGFADAEYDEAPHAAAVAQHLGTDHTELYMGPEDLLGVVPRMPDVYSEPFADSSQLPTTVVCALARSCVKVVLSGDGGDELFGGYARYRRAEATWPSNDRAARVLRRQAARALGAFGTRFPTSSTPTWGVLPSPLRGKALGVAAAGRARGLGAASFVDFYHDMVSDWSDPARVVIGVVDEVDQTWPSLDDMPSKTELMMLTDLVTYLPEDILVKVDRASMAVGLESRVPLLDPRLVELSWQLPLDMKIRGDEDKWILRQVAHRHIPRALLDRPKQGFGVPIGAWLRGPLRPWADDLLARDRLTAEGNLHAEVVCRIWAAHKRGETDWSRWLWNILMFQAWLDRWSS